VSGNTDFFAQMANMLDKGEDDFQDYADGAKISGTAQEKLVNLDLNLHSDSILVGSIAEICQGVIGQLISEKGGLEAMINSKQSFGETRDQIVKDFQEHKRFLKAEMMMELSDVIQEAIEERIKPRAQSDALRERVENFKLLPEDHVVIASDATLNEVDTQELAEARVEKLREEWSARE